MKITPEQLESLKAKFPTTKQKDLCKILPNKTRVYLRENDIDEPVLEFNFEHSEYDVELLFNTLDNFKHISPKHIDDDYIYGSVLEMKKVITQMHDNVCKIDLQYFQNHFAKDVKKYTEDVLYTYLLLEDI